MCEVIVKCNEEEYKFNINETKIRYVLSILEEYKNKDILEFGNLIVTIISNDDGSKTIYLQLKDTNYQLKICDECDVNSNELSLEDIFIIYVNNILIDDIIIDEKLVKPFRKFLFQVGEVYLPQPKYITKKYLRKLLLMIDFIIGVRREEIYNISSGVLGSLVRKTGLKIITIDNIQIYLPSTPTTKLNNQEYKSLLLVIDKFNEHIEQFKEYLRIIKTEHKELIPLIRSVKLRKFEKIKIGKDVTY